ASCPAFSISIKRFCYRFHRLERNAVGMWVYPHPWLLVLGGGQAFPHVPTSRHWRPYYSIMMHCACVMSLRPLAGSNGWSLRNKLEYQFLNTLTSVNTKSRSRRLKPTPTRSRPVLTHNAVPLCVRCFLIWGECSQLVS